MALKNDFRDERRSFRVDFRIPVRITLPDSKTILDANLENVSVHGMLVDLEDASSQPDCNCQDICSVQLIFPGNGSRLIIDELESKIIRFENGQISFEFIEPLDWFLLFNVYKSKQIS